MVGYLLKQNWQDNTQAKLEIDAASQLESVSALGITVEFAASLKLGFTKKYFQSPLF